ncbi:MAG TPA: hypothetical protein VGU46_10190 [Acidobacteriaceae bacterium]|nr:hypothetical protein [Acidobacteriaceae bacterium]
MSQTTISVEVPDDLAKAAIQRALHEGKSLDQWVRSALEERVRLERSAEEFFKKRAAGSTGQGLRWALDHVPDRPPDPGDEL